MAFLAILLAGLLSGCQSYRLPVTPEVLACLPAQQADQLAVWSTNHADLFWQFHNLETCPYLVYTPAWIAYQVNHDDLAWVMFLYHFYCEKHRFEDGCTCTADLADKKEN